MQEVPGSIPGMDLKAFLLSFIVVAFHAVQKTRKLVANFGLLRFFCERILLAVLHIPSVICTFLKKVKFRVRVRINSFVKVKDISVVCSHHDSTFHRL